MENIHDESGMGKASRITEPMDNDLSKCQDLVARLMAEAEKIENEKEETRRLRNENKELREALIKVIKYYAPHSIRRPAIIARTVLEKWK